MRISFNNLSSSSSRFGYFLCNKVISHPRHKLTQLMANCYTAEEVKSHDNSSDCWVIYKGKVYDVTPFLEDVKFDYYDLLFSNSL